MAYTPKKKHIASACVLLMLISSQSYAQSETTLAPVVVTDEKGTGYVAKGAMIGGPGGTEEVELKDAPASISVISRDLLDDRQVKLISEAVRTDASVGDYYATLGYYENLSIRGFSLDPATSFRMNGMSLTGEQNFAFENKERVEILKGVSAMQAGASSPGGIVNFVTKRPKDIMSATVGTGERGTEYVAADFGTFLNKEKSLGIRINAAHEDIKPFVEHAKGKREFVSLAVDAKLSNKTLAQFDIEYQDKSQIGVSGLMLLGDAVDGSNARVPTGISPDIQLNRHSWVLPTEIKSLNTGLKIDHELNDNNRVFFHLSRSEVKINDRQAYPLPLSGGTFGPTGDFTVSDFRSENELRRNDQIQIGLSTKFNTGSIEHQVKYGVSILQRSIFQGQARFQSVGTDNIYTLNAAIPVGSDGLGPRTKTLDHQQNSFFIQDNLKINDKVNLYLSSRFIELSDQSFSATASQLGKDLGEFKKNYFLPSVGLTYKLSPKTTNYISYSEGVESGTKPIETSFRNTTPLKPRKTDQVELGVKHALSTDSLIAATLFRATRPNEYVDQNTYDPVTFTYEKISQDGRVVHTGLELSYAQKVTKRLNLTSSAMYLEARQEGSSVISQNGSQAIGIPNWRGAVFADYLIPNVENLSAQGGWTYVSSKGVTLSNSIKVPGYHKFDAGLKYIDKVGESKATYRVFVENLFDTFYWRDVSQTYGSNTLYPGAPRIFRASATFDF
jgi:iron complex outermembrane receptor protein